MSKVTATIAIVVVVYFRNVSVNISLNFICFIIENYLYYFDYACKLLKTKIINLCYLELLFLLPLLWLLVCGNLFPILFIRLAVALLLLLTFDRFICYSDRSNLVWKKKPMNLGYLKLLLLALLLFVAFSCSFCSYA